MIRRCCIAGLLGAATLAVAVPSPLAAQRGELTILGGIVRDSDEEFDRVTSGTMGAPIYTRERGSRSAGASVGLAFSAALRGHVFAEMGVLSHAVERNISRTGTGDHTGPFLITTTSEGRIISFWLGPAYRFVDRERLAVSAVAAPVLQLLQGEAFGRERTDKNAASGRAAMGVLVGLRARYWITDRIGAQLTVDDAMWTFPLLPHESEGTEFYPEASRHTPRQHDLRLQLGVTVALF